MSLSFFPLSRLLSLSLSCPPCVGRSTTTHQRNWPDSCPIFAIFTLTAYFVGYNWFAMTKWTFSQLMPLKSYLVSYLVQQYTDNSDCPAILKLPLSSQAEYCCGETCCKHN